MSLDTLPPQPYPQSPRHSSENYSGQTTNRERINQLELSSALEDFAIMRGKRKLGLNRIYTDAEKEAAGLETMMPNYALLGNVKEREQQGETSGTIGVPVAILTENPDTLADVIEKVSATAESSVDVVVWANAKYSSDNEDEVKAEAQRNYDYLVDKLQKIDNDDLRIQGGLQILPEDELFMSVIRSNYMDAIAIDSVKQGYGFDHPILWVDADTTFISKGVVRNIASSVRNHDAYIVHANSLLTVDWASGRPLGELDDATKAVAVNEIRRRQLYREDDPDKFPGAYIEESGFAFALGIYLKTDGVKTSTAINESGWIVENIVANEIIDGPMFPERLQGHDKKTNMFKLIRSAKLGTSARRHYELAKESGATALEDSDGSGYEDTFTDIKKNDANPTITAKEMGDIWRKKIAYLEKLKSYDPLTERSVRATKTASALLGRYFKD